ncbi:MAG TPA: hypothetical protein VGR57_07690 [Ktedonobacterales bacterium]|nr:hypothetical protein [Ktedonobacterales bacterium]
MLKPMMLGSSAPSTCEMVGSVPALVFSQGIGFTLTNALEHGSVAARATCVGALTSSIESVAERLKSKVAATLAIAFDHLFRMSRTPPTYPNHHLMATREHDKVRALRVSINHWCQSSLMRVALLLKNRGEMVEIALWQRRHAYRGGRQTRRAGRTLERQRLRAA